MSDQRLPRKHSYFEATARERIARLLDAGSFQEWLGPQARVSSPHLGLLDLPVAFDDGVIVGQGSLTGRTVLVAAQEGGFMGGSVGEVHGAKITGLLENAVATKPAGVLLLLESGGVRLHEANAGLIAISEIMRALFVARAAGIPVVALIGGANGCFGGMGIVARCCDRVIMSEQGRLALSGPEVIETVKGAEEFDSRDRALVWRTVGGKHRYLLGEADVLVDDDIAAFSSAASAALDTGSPLTLDAIEAEHALLARRAQATSNCRDALDIWMRMGIECALELPLMQTDVFLEAVQGRKPL